MTAFPYRSEAYLSEPDAPDTPEPPTLEHTWELVAVNVTPARYPYEEKVWIRYTWKRTS